MYLSFLDFSKFNLCGCFLRPLKEGEMPNWVALHTKRNKAHSFNLSFLFLPFLISDRDKILISSALIVLHYFNKNLLLIACISIV